MNLLDLLVRLHSETGRQGTTPTAVTGLTGEMLRLLNWIKTSYEDIQLRHETWRFRRESFSGPTVATTQNYTASDMSVTDLSAWWYDPRPGELSGITIYENVGDERHLEFVPWDYFVREYKFGSRRTQAGPPSVFSIKPDDTIDLWPIPDSVLTLNGEYIKQPDEMSGASDVPVFNDFHMILVWKALQYYGAKAGRNDMYVHGQNQYRDLLLKMEHRYLPKLEWGGPLV